MESAPFDPSTYPGLTSTQSTLIKQIYAFTETYFQNPKFDASHDFRHVMRVVRNAVNILEQERKLQAAAPDTDSDLDVEIVILAALLHDVEDRKYVDDASKAASALEGPLAKRELLRLGVAEERAGRIQRVVDGVSYSSEMKDPQKLKELVASLPELAIVQDADRLDAIGAIGVARCFTFGGAKRTRSLGHSVDHFDDKLLKLEGMMKTETGKNLAAIRSARIREFLAWWAEEVDFSGPS